jgi:hypothetical protein
VVPLITLKAVQFQPLSPQPSGSRELSGLDSRVIDIRRVHASVSGNPLAFYDSQETAVFTMKDGLIALAYYSKK